MDSETQIEAKCRFCGRMFMAEVCVLPGKRYVASVCDGCQKKRQEEQEKEEAARELMAMQALWQNVCPVLYRHTDSARLPQTQLAEVLAWQYGPEGLLLVGPTGVGKTRMVYLLLQRLLFGERRRVRTFDGLAFDHECVRRFRDEGDGEEWADGLAHVDVVFFDDIGKGCFTPRVEAEMFGLIERRAANGLPIIATTNMTGADLAAKVTEDRGAPLIRRLREFCKCVTFA